ncbi:hypothetical protein ABZW03_20820 [Kitasatospora sp. NPDC004799]|uniref:hypothetical protein n=1 Tax=Kitasatospora sp. NPDC004799 TaxID=3154460 RepID=UPI0033A55DFE
MAGKNEPGKNTGAGGPSGIGDRPQDDFVARNLGGPSERPARTLTLSGLLGDSDRAGYRRLYFNKQLDYYAEFASEDVLSVEDVGSDQPPFVGLDATEVTLRRDATVHFTQVETPAPVDDFDLDLRLGQGGEPGGLPRTVGPVTTLPRTAGGGGCIAPTDFACNTDFDCPTVFRTGCRPFTCLCTQDGACHTRFGATCRTCDTCVTCGQDTCRTCNDRTCFTCNAPCITLTRTQITCDQATCGGTCDRTCVTCNAVCITATRITNDACRTFDGCFTQDEACVLPTRVTCVVCRPPGQ